MPPPLRPRGPSGAKGAPKPAEPFASLTIAIEELYVDKPRGDKALLVKRLASAGFYILAASPELLLAPPFVKTTNPEGTIWTFKQWRPGARPRR